MEHSTLKKLSEVLGISISTVSRALKNHPDIAEKTKIKVRELAATMEYEPNNYAVLLRTKKSNAIGIMVPSIDNFFYDSFIAAVEEEARVHGYSVIIMQSRDKFSIESANLQLFRKNMVMGLFASISIETEDMAPFNKMEDMGTPVVFIDRVPTDSGYYKVCMADEEAAKIAAMTIIEKKKKKVLALFGHPHLSITQKRYESFKETFEKVSPKTKLLMKYIDSIAESERIVLEAMKEKNKPDTIFCMGDLILIGAMHAVHKLNLKVPEEVAMISISNGFIPNMYNPQITYVETSGVKLGKLAFAQMLLRLKQDENIAPEVILPAALVKGGSI